VVGPVADNKKEQIIAQANEQILRLRAEIAGWESFVEAATQSPAFLPKLEAMLLDPKSNGVPHPEHMAPQRQPRLPSWQRVWTYLMAKGNDWASIRQIMDGTGLKRNSVNEAIYNGGKTYLFETIKREGGRTYWRVKEEFTDKNKVPLLSEQPDAESQNAQPPVEPAVAEINKIVEATKPEPVTKPKKTKAKKTNPKPVPKYRPANWDQKAEALS